LNDYKIYDIYRDEKLGNKLSMTFSLEFVSHDKTLTDVEVSNEVDALISNLGKKLNIELRQ
jgi:Phenylalanyl-tRNA synthetase beta subunit